MGIRNPKSREKALKGNPKCKHPRDHVERHWNRKGAEFRECNICEAFLGFTGRKRAT